MGGAAGNRAAAAAEGSGGSQIEHTFGRPMVLAKLGQYIMDIKVRLVLEHHRLLPTHAAL
jgi:hypothetical protein